MKKFKNRRSNLSSSSAATVSRATRGGDHAAVQFMLECCRDRKPFSTQANFTTLPTLRMLSAVAAKQGYFGSQEEASTWIAENVSVVR